MHKLNLSVSETDFIDASVLVITLTLTAMIVISLVLSILTSVNQDVHCYIICLSS